VFGSTADRVLRRTDVPVLAVPLGGTPLVSLGRKGPVFGIERVVGALDLRPGSLALARLAAGVARDFHASLLLAHVVPGVQATSRWRTSRDEATSLAVETAWVEIDDLTKRLDVAVAVQTLVATGHPADTITQLAHDRRAQLVVIGTGTGREGANRPGSTAYRVLGASTVPVLAMPPLVATDGGSDREARRARRLWSAPDAPISSASTKGRPSKHEHDNPHGDRRAWPWEPPTRQRALMSLSRRLVRDAA